MKDLFQSTSHIQSHLSQAGIPSAVIGGLAVAVWGEPRLTRDVDLKVFLKRDDAHRLVTLLQPKYTCLADNPEKMLRNVGFLFIKEADGPRIDMLLADTPFDEEAIRRARPVEVEPKTTLIICRAEDVILYKMISTRPRDREDVRGILLRQKNVDDLYVLNWLRQFEKAFDDSTLVQEYERLKKG